MPRDNQNVIIPWKEELNQIASKSGIVWRRPDRQRGTNCTWEMLNYINKRWENIRLYSKRSILRVNQAQFEEDYKKLKWIFKNIVPNQWFTNILWDTFAFCAPISVKVDIFLDWNDEYVIEMLRQNKRLMKQMRFFIRKFEELLTEWKVLDLYWNENLVISEDDKLYYLDSFLVFHSSDTIKWKSLENFEKLKGVVKIAENQDI